MSFHRRAAPKMKEQPPWGAAHYAKRGSVGVMFQDAIG